MAELWTPDKKPDEKQNHVFGFPPAVMVAAVGIAEHAIRKAEESPRSRSRRVAKRRAAKRARRLNQR